VRIVVPSNQVFRPVHQSKQRYIAMKGSAGSGKSVDTAQQYILRLMTEKGRNLMCVRKAEVTNRDSTYAELISAINRMRVESAWRYTVNPMMISCLNGNKIIFRGANHEREREKLKSITVDNGKLTDVWIEEATELTKQDFEIIDDRLRGELPDGQFYQIKMTFNPVSATHWIKADFFDRPDPEVLTHHSTYLDNRFVDAAYKRRMERRKEIDPEGYQIYGLGNWGETGGLILHNWKIEEFDTDYSNFSKKVLSQDFGFNHANAILDIGFREGQIYICDELYLYEKDTAEIIELAKQNGFDRRLHMWCDSAEPDRIRMWRKAGYKAEAVKKEPGSVNAQIDYLKQQRIIVHPRCVNTIKELQQWKWKLDQQSGLYLDEPVEYMDDAMAALRYSIEDLRRLSNKVKAVSKNSLGLR
jgi:phage terminase, large subunit, PBSX family